MRGQEGVGRPRSQSVLGLERITEDLGKTPRRKKDTGGNLREKSATLTSGDVVRSSGRPEGEAQLFLKLCDDSIDGNKTKFYLMIMLWDTNMTFILY